jgi:hypothetical protein
MTFVVWSDSATNLSLTSFDVNRQPLTFAMDSSPLNGLVSSPMPSGAFVFMPAHGFSGTNTFAYHAFDGRTNSPPGTVVINVVAPADANHDELPDMWQSTYGITDPNGDADNDGVSNIAEYWANTNPTNPASYLRLVGITPSATNGVTIAWEAVGGTRYRVSFTDDAQMPFTDIPRPVAREMHPGAYGSSSIVTFTDDFTLTGGPPASGLRLYRIRVVQ